MPISLLVLALPLAEIALFILVGGWIGLWPTLGLTVASTLAGGWILRTQGLRTAAGLRGAMDRLADPTGPMAHGAMILLAGVLLILPGFLSDTVALALLVPPVRRLILARLAGRVTVRTTSGFRRDPHRPDVIDGEFHEITAEDRIAAPPRRDGPPSGWTRH
jgi:UPF0716 protein FxsA